MILVSTVDILTDFPSNGEVRLRYDYDRPFFYQGVGEVYLEEEWGTVANDDSWTIEDGEVVCRELGFEVPSEHGLISMYILPKIYFMLLLHPLSVHS